MKVKILILFAFITLFNCSALPVIEVYTESLCPDCMDFIGGAFQNFYSNPDHNKLATVNFLCFGNASERWNQQSQRYDFTCQHGPAECEGNVIETCALNKLTKDQGFQFLICFEYYLRSVSRDYNSALQYCVRDDNVRLSIKSCAYSAEGNSLEHQVAQRTSTHNYVPWITYNGYHDVNVENQLLYDMNGYLCSLGNNRSLPGCQYATPNFALHKGGRCPNTFSSGSSLLFLQDN